MREKVELACSRRRLLPPSMRGVRRKQWLAIGRKKAQPEMHCGKTVGKRDPTG